MSGGERPEVDRRLIKALGHETRVGILEILQERVASPVEMAKEMSESLAQITYHTDVLVKCECLELVDTRKSRGATEHFYRAKPRAFIGARDWRKVPRSVRGGVTGPALQGFFDKSIVAYEAGNLDESEETALGCTTIVVDGVGLVQATELLDGALTGLEAVHEQSLERLKMTGGSGTRMIVGCAGFVPADPDQPRQG